MSETQQQPQRGAAVALIVVSAVAVLSLIAAVAAFYMGEQERQKRIGLEQELTLVTAAKNAAQAELDQVKAEKVKADEELARLRQDALALTSELAAQKEANAKVTKDLQDKQDEIAKVTKDLQKERGDRVTLSEELTKAKGDYQQLKEELEQIKSDKASVENKLREVGAKQTVELEKIVVKKDQPAAAAAAGPSLGPDVPSAQQLAGKVLVVNREFDFVVINLGKTSGAQIGNVFEVVRGNDVLGKVKIEKVYDSLSAAAILPDSAKEQIHEGDAVRTL